MTAIYQSVTGWIDQNIVLNYLIINEDDAGLGKFIKLGLGVVAFPLLALAGLVETAVRSVFLLLAKMVQFFMPKDSGASKWMNENIMDPLIHQISITAKYVTFAGYFVVGNVLSNETSLSVADTINEAFENLPTTGFFQGFKNIHINGFDS